MGETDFIHQVITTAKQYGWLVHHDERSIRFIPKRGTYVKVRNADPGFPDLVLVHPERRIIVFAECKDDRSNTTVEQADWLEAIRVSLPPTYLVAIWRPRDLETIYALLATGHWMPKR